jgi:hypothetical protein
MSTIHRAYYYIYSLDQIAAATAGEEQQCTSEQNEMTSPTCWREQDER